MAKQTKNEGEDVAAEAPKPKLRGALRAAMSRNTEGNTLGNVRGLPRRKATFTIDKDVCAPGVFDDDIDVTLISINSDMELKAIRDCKGDPTSLAFLLARASVYAINGEPVNDAEGEREWLWEALGNGGRAILVGMFGQFGTADAESQGKAMRSLRVES